MREMEGKDKFLPEGGQLDQVVVGHAFDRMSGFAPGTQSTGDDEHFESDILQLAPDPGARGFALSSAVEINLAIFGKVLDLFDEVVGFDANGAGNAFGVGIVVAMAPDVGDKHVPRRIGR